MEHISILEGGPNYESPQLFRVNTQRPALYFLARVADLPNPPGKVPSFKQPWNPTLTSKSTTLGWATRPAPRDTPLVGRWSSAYSYALLGVLTVACLLPFSGRAFHIDDPLFVFAARQITQHPLDPYGFNVIWYESLDRMADVTMNPPLACYYGAAVGRIAGWSERAFHIAFLVPALALILGTYRLAKHFTRLPLLAGLATVLTPGILVSACSVMCDTMMVALWVWAVILWIEGIEPRKAWYLAGSGVLIAAAVLTKYFGAALILLLAAYSLARLRRLGNWMWYLLIPIGALVGYELWTHALYGQSLLLSAVHFAHANRGLSRWSRPLVGLSFTGGCALSVLALCPLMWSRRVQGIVAAASALAASAFILGWVKMGRQFAEKLTPHPLLGHWELIGSQLALFIAGGVFTLALAITDYWKKRDPDSLLLGLWVVGTYFFTIRLNWAVNARSVLPLIPAAAILAARRLETTHRAWTRSLKLQVAGALIVSGVLSIWVAAADMHLANLAREAAQSVRARTSREVGTLWYEGHWGFQYYMEQLGALPADARDLRIRPGEFVAVPENNARFAGIPPDMSFQTEAVFDLPNPSGAATLSWQLGAGFYSSYWGPLPFAFGPAPPEHYVLLRASPVR